MDIHIKYRINMAMSKAVETSLVVLILISVCLLVSGYRGIMVGGRREVKDVKTNEEVQELGRYSVEEFNKQLRRHGENGELVFFEVVEAQTQVVSGIKYYLKIQATAKNGETKMFDSVVVVKAWAKSKELLRFAPSTEYWIRND